MKFTNYLLYALVGWLAGLVMTVAFSWFWQAIFPVIERTGQGAGLPIVLSIILFLVTPLAIAGGIIGGRLQREGGRGSQLLFAAIFGVLFIIPVSCFLFWYTGW
jgi:hypothetical protein